MICGGKGFLNAMSDNVFEQLRRSRRNLMAVSIILSFASYAGLSINTINLLGNEFTISNPNAIQIALWVLWAYSLWQFWGYSNEIERGVFLKYRTFLEKNVRREIDKKTSAEYDIYETYRTHWIANERANVSGFLERGKEIKIEGWAFHSCKARAVISLCLHTSKFSDYILPFLVASSPVIVLLLNQI